MTRQGEDAKARLQIVLASTNRGKLAEFARLLNDLPIDLRPLDEVIPHPPSVAEDGATFAQNAIKKARAAADATQLLALADDSGLEVDALKGQPGVRSARYAYDGATDAENNAALLSALDALDPAGSNQARPYSARFRCVLALVDPRGGDPAQWTVDGVCEGTLADAPRGLGGFGYDPLFIPAGANKTMAELSREEKNRISHRALAVAALRPILSARSLSK
jgi:XTP/dITP diphosphohydrolase